MKSDSPVAPAARLLLLLAASLTVAGAAANEATEFELPQTTQTRQQVRNALAAAQADNRLLSRGEASIVEPPKPAGGSRRSRRDIEAEARMGQRPGAAETARRDQFSGG